MKAMELAIGILVGIIVMAIVGIYVYRKYIKR